MNKRILSIVIVLSMCLAMFPLPVAAIDASVSAAYADGVVTVTGTGFTNGIGYIVRIVDKVNSSVKAMGQVTAGGSGSISASITTGALGETADYTVYVNNPDGTLAGAADSIQQIVRTWTVTATAGSNGSISPAVRTVNAGENAVFTVIPDQCYEVDTVSAGIYDAENNTVTLYNVQTDSEVHVTFKPIKVKSVALNKTTATIEVNGSVTLIADVQPGNAKNKDVTWSSGNTGIATVENGVVTGIRAGTTVITVTTVDGGFTAACSVSVIRNSSGSEDGDKDDSDRTTTPTVQPTPPTTPPVPAAPNNPAAGLTGSQQVVVSVNADAMGVTQNGNTATVTVEGDAIAAAAQSAQQQAEASAAAAVVAISPQLPENVSEMTVQLPGYAVSGLANAGVGLQINTGFASIQLSPEMLGNFSSTGNISLSIRSVDPEEEIDALPEGMRPVGNGIDLEFGPIGSNASGSIIIAVLIGDDVNRDLVALYYLNESTGELTFVGGRTGGSMLQGETDHNSKYFVMEYKKQFKDTKPDSWYSKYVESMVAKHVISGHPDGTFKGTADITRGEFAAALVRALGLKPVSYKGRFTDINSKDYYADAIQSLYDKGIMIGSSKELFSPEAGITREEIFAIIGRVAEANSSDGTKLANYTDAGELSAWAVDGAAKAVAGKIIVGEGSRLNPKSRLTKYEAAVILYRLFNR